MSHFDRLFSLDVVTSLRSLASHAPRRRKPFKFPVVLERLEDRSPPSDSMPLLAGATFLISSETTPMLAAMMISGLTADDDAASLRPQIAPEFSSSVSRSAHEPMRDGSLADAVERLFAALDGERRRDGSSSADSASDNHSNASIGQTSDSIEGLPSGLLANLLGKQVVSGLSSEDVGTTEASPSRSGFTGDVYSVSVFRRQSQDDVLPSHGAGSASTLGTDLASGFAIGTTSVSVSTVHTPNAGTTNAQFGGAVTLAPRAAHSETNDPPVAEDDYFEVVSGSFYADEPMAIYPLWNDIDPNGDPLTITSVSPSAGSAWIDSVDPSLVWFQPPAGGMPDNYSPIELAYQITDSRGEFAQAKMKENATVRALGPGIMVTDHQVTRFLEPRHTAILIIPTNQETWSADPRFRSVTISGTAYHYVTISAGPVYNSSAAQILQSDLNRASDHPRNQAVVDWFQAPGSIPEDQFISLLLDLNASYQDDLPYDFFPESTPAVDYNSNSYVHGLLNAAFVAPQPNLGLATKHPGWETPVPIEAFD